MQTPLPEPRASANRTLVGLCLGAQWPTWCLKPKIFSPLASDSRTCILRGLSWDWLVCVLESITECPTYVSGPQCLSGGKLYWKCNLQSLLYVSRAEMVANSLILCGIPVPRRLWPPCSWGHLKAEHFSVGSSFPPFCRLLSPASSPFLPSLPAHHHA